MKPQDLELKPTVGLVGGLTIQFAEARPSGRLQDEIGDGVALSEAGFDLVEPHLRSACPEWTDMHRYGVFELAAQARASLAMLLRCEAARVSEASERPRKKADLFGHLADWLDARCDDRPISIFGV